MSIFINEQAFIFVLFVFQLLNHSDETSTILGGHSIFTGWDNAPFAAPPHAGYGPDIKYLNFHLNRATRIIIAVCKTVNRELWWLQPSFRRV